jgi:hypothetical protein
MRHACLFPPSKERRFRLLPDWQAYHSLVRNNAWAALLTERRIQVGCIRTIRLDPAAQVIVCQSDHPRPIRTRIVGFSIVSLPGLRQLVSFQSAFSSPSVPRMDFTIRQRER